jgi:hypothetical protein
MMMTYSAWIAFVQAQHVLSSSGLDGVEGLQAILTVVADLMILLQQDFGVSSQLTKSIDVSMKRPCLQHLTRRLPSSSQLAMQLVRCCQHSKHQSFEYPETCLMLMMRHRQRLPLKIQTIYWKMPCVELERLRRPVHYT